MNIFRTVRVVLLLLFALLQCVAPLAHAHVNGHNAGHAVHMDSVDSPWGNDHDAGITHLTIEKNHSAFVSMPPEYRFSDHSIALPAFIDIRISLTPCEQSPLSYMTVDGQRVKHSSYQHPCSQAPPV
jgi:hypothetical protein